MSLPETKQAITVLGRSDNILLLVPPKPSADAFASCLSTYLALLEHHPGHIDAVSPSHVPPALQFLPGSSQIIMEPQTEPQIILDIAGPTTIKQVRHHSLEGGLRIHISLPAQQSSKSEVGPALTKDSIEVHVRALPYDALITFGTTDLEELGPLFTNHADFFYNTPIINIDHRSSNEHYGTVNLVDITASSIAEVTHEFISTLKDINITGNIATCLYAGIVAATESFQKPSTTPHAFALAADLLNHQADKELVIQNLVKTKPLPLLKLSGRAFARLRYDEHGRLFWTLLKDVDFRDSGADSDLITDVMHELESNISGFNVAFIIYPTQSNTYAACVKLGKGLLKRRQDIQKELGATRLNGLLHLPLPTNSIEQAEDQALEKIRKIVPKNGS